ncbi:hypothetical protein ACE1OC_06875 [Streptomyces sp. DSM 116496]|uniref:hypothetical protein n=1 Tax=Streptomyces stoeckheimensis TaxID=3344656 RepID=UPI0038B38CD0
MTITPMLPLPIRASRWRALLSWLCCVAALLLAVTVCHRPAPAAAAVASSVSTATTAVGAEDGGAMGDEGWCVHHQPGDPCLTGLQHLPQTIVQLPDEAVVPAGGHLVTPAQPRAGPGIVSSAGPGGIDLHALQVLRI